MENTKFTYLNDPAFVAFINKGKLRVSPDNYSSTEYFNLLENEQFRHFQTIISNDMFLEVVYKIISAVVLSKVMTEHNEKNGVTRQLPFAFLLEYDYESILMVVINAVMLCNVQKVRGKISSPVEHIEYFYSFFNGLNMNSIFLIMLVEKICFSIVDGKCVCIQCAHEHNDKEMLEIIEELYKI